MISEKQSAYDKQIYALTQRLADLKKEAERDFEAHVLQNGVKITKMEFIQIQAHNYSFPYKFLLTDELGGMYLSVHDMAKDKPLHKGKEDIDVYKFDFNEVSKERYKHLSEGSSLVKGRFVFYISYMAVIPFEYAS